MEISILNGENALEKKERRMSKKGSKRFWKKLNGEISILNGDFSILNGENALEKKERHISKKGSKRFWKRLNGENALEKKERQIF